MGELDALKRKQIAAATLASEQWMDAVLGEAQRIVLLDEGTLAGSADRETQIRGDGIEVVGSFNTIYAARRHEDMDVTPSVAGRQPKFLEEPFNRAVPTYEPIVAGAVAKVSG